MCVRFFFLSLSLSPFSLLLLLLLLLLLFLSLKTRWSLFYFFYRCFHLIVCGTAKVDAIKVTTMSYDSHSGLLTKKFINLIKHAEDGILDLNKAADTLEVLFYI